MPRRLVYSPKAWVFVKNTNGKIYDVSNYVTSGQVNRLINQVSTASITLRNPDKIFTTPGAGQVFYPQDPITIFLQRLAGRPVRVFTGYIDQSVYYQMYPGTITLTASCTLKKLLYTFFDPSLPYMVKFFEKNGGWINKGDGTIIAPGEVGNSKGGQGTGLVNLTDNSLAKLLLATLVEIGEWDKSRIYIEPIPNGSEGISALMSKLMRSFQQEETITQSEFTTFMNTVIGSGAYGTGGASNKSLPKGNPGTLSQGARNRLNSNQTSFTLELAKQTGMDANVMAAWVVQEEGGAATAPNGANNWLNIGAVDSGAWQGGNNDFWNDPIKAADATANWMKGTVVPGYGAAAAGIQAILQSANQSPVDQIKAIQLSPWATSHEPSLPAIYSGFAVTSIPSTPLTPFIIPSVAPPDQTTRGTTDKKGTHKTTSKVQTRYNDILEAADAIDKANYPYAWAGGHVQVGVPSPAAAEPSNPSAPVGQIGFDCSGAVSAVLYAAGLLDSPQSSVTMQSALGAAIADGVDNSSNAVNIFARTDHIFMQIGGTYWGTWDGVSEGDGSNQGAGWNKAPATAEFLKTFTAFHVTQSTLNTQWPYQLSLTGSATAPPGGTSGGVGTDGSTNVMGTAIAASFVNQLQVPSIEDSVEAVMLGQQGRGLMHDQNLLPFVQQICQSTLRNFMSLPTGDFYAFYPDYFGEFGHHEPYWMIDDIELLSGDISLTDENLATHVFAIGDTTWPVGNQMVNDLFSAGTVTIFNAFISGTTGTATTTRTGDFTNFSETNFINLFQKNEVNEFIKRYGARPLVANFPMVRSPIFEMLLAYQLFCLAWSRQFISNFEFTFMPELFPGGKVGFRDHGIQMYIESVTHTFDYESGFTTLAQLSAPAVMTGSSNPDLPPNMVAALVEPLRNQNSTTTQGTRSKTQDSNFEALIAGKEHQLIGTSK